MKRLATLLLAAGLVFGISTGASAVDFKAKGRWIMDFDYGQHGNFVKGYGTKTGGQFKKNDDEFDAEQRLRLTLEAVASENLSGTVQFEMGWQRWGQRSTGGDLGSDGNVVKIKHSYIDWIVPQTDLKVRMGLQPLALPSFTTGSQILDNDVAGVSLNYQFTDNVGLTFFWARPYNDNGKYPARNRNGGNYEISNYMDNVDLFALTLPLTFDGVKVTPFAMLGFMGPGSLDNSQLNNRDAGTSLSGGEYDNYAAGMYPFGGRSHRHGGEATEKRINSYGTAWWAGLTADITMFDPFRVAFDFNYGATNWQDDSRLNRKGWIATALAEYKLDFMTPGIVGWYSSGDDGNPANGSERMPSMSASDDANNDFSNFAFTGGPTINRENVIGYTMMGTWGIGLRLKDISFIEDLKHTFRVNYIGGTNSPKMVRKMAKDTKYREWGNDRDRVYQVGGGIGYDNLYMTTNDHAIEFSLQNEYKIYENLKMLLSASYLATSLGNNRIYQLDADGNRIRPHKRASISDPWNINLQFQYAF